MIRNHRPLLRLLLPTSRGIIVAASSSSSSSSSLSSSHSSRSSKRRASSSPPFSSSSSSSSSSSYASDATTRFRYDAPWLLHHYHRDDDDANNNNAASSSSSNNAVASPPPPPPPPHFANFVNGTFVRGGGSSSPSSHHRPVPSSTDIPLRDPSTNDLLSTVPRSSVDDAVAAARDAYPGWSGTPVQARQRLLAEYANLLHAREIREEIAYWITLENGKTTADAMGDVWRGLEVVEAASRVGSDMLGDSIQNLSSGLDTVSYRMPLGVCAGIAPFNFPAMIALWMFPLAIACGNTFVLKPTEKAPSASMLLVKHLHDLGLPHGVVNVVNGGRETVNELLVHPDVKAVSFVGSNGAGEHVHDLGSRNGKRVQANLGAKNHATVMMDDFASKDHRRSTVRALVGAAFGAAGQRCMALSVVILVGGKEDADAWVEEMVGQAGGLKVGNGFVEGVDVGPMISRDAARRAEDIIRRSIDMGADCPLDGRGIIVAGYENGNFLGPTVLDLGRVAANSPVLSNPSYAEEIFGPVLTVLSVPTLDDAVSVTNGNRYGNGAAIFTTSGGAARKFQYEVEAGQVGINVPIPVPLPFFSFTGNKSSIRGDLNFYGKGGVNFFTQLKTVTSNWQYRGGADFGGVTMPVLGKPR